MELLDREIELETLSRELTNAVSGVGHVILVTGEAGIGKTSLISVFLQESI